MEKQLEQPKPIVIDELDKTGDKVDFSKLNEGDRFQLTTRYLNEVCSITKSTLQIVADIYILLEFICEDKGINVKAKKLELAERVRAQMEENEKKLKRAMKKIKAN